MKFNKNQSGESVDIVTGQREIYIRKILQPIIYEFYQRIQKAVTIYFRVGLTHKNFIIKKAIESLLLLLCFSFNVEAQQPQAASWSFKEVTQKKSPVFLDDQSGSLFYGDTKHFGRNVVNVENNISQFKYKGSENLKDLFKGAVSYTMTSPNRSLYPLEFYAEDTLVFRKKRDDADSNGQTLHSYNLANGQESYFGESGCVPINLSAELYDPDLRITQAYDPKGSGDDKCNELKVSNLKTGSQKIIEVKGHILNVSQKGEVLLLGRIVRAENRDTSMKFHVVNLITAKVSREFVGDVVWNDWRSGSTETLITDRYIIFSKNKIKFRFDILTEKEEEIASFPTDALGGVPLANNTLFALVDRTSTFESTVKIVDVGTKKIVAQFDNMKKFNTNLVSLVGIGDEQIIVQFEKYNRDTGNRIYEYYYWDAEKKKITDFYSLPSPGRLRFSGSLRSKNFSFTATLDECMTSEGSCSTLYFVESNSLKKHKITSVGNEASIHPGLIEDAKKVGDFIYFSKDESNIGRTYTAHRVEKFKIVEKSMSENIIFPNQSLKRFTSREPGMFSRDKRLVTLMENVVSIGRKDNGPNAGPYVGSLIVIDTHNNNSLARLNSDHMVYEKGILVSERYIVYQTVSKDNKPDKIYMGKLDD